MNHVNILILMSTYNGSMYIREQLESIFGQKDVNVRLLIRDDGSTDDTLAIIDELRGKYPDSTTIISGNNIGWKKSFFELASYAYEHYPSFDYYSFSDQDDIWLPEKLSKAVECLQSMPEGANLYCSNLIFFKDGMRQGLVRDKKIIPDPKGALIRNYATGCTVVMNRSLLSLIAKGSPKVDMAHDYWSYLLANLCGHVFIDHNSYILYRQHQSNQIGCRKTRADVWRRRFLSLSSLFGGRYRETMANELLRMHEDNMHEAGHNAVNRIADYRHSLKKRIALLFDSGYTFNSKSNDLWLKLRILSGRL